MTKGPFFCNKIWDLKGSPIKIETFRGPLEALYLPIYQHFYQSYFGPCNFLYRLNQFGKRFSRTKINLTSIKMNNSHRNQSKRKTFPQVFGATAGAPYKAFRHVETLFVQGNQVRTE